MLIHSATGGTGMAAIAVARMLGAEVLATAGSEDKRRYLRGMGIRHVMDSRTLEFGERTREATHGEGVDVVLNSLSGAAIRTGLRRCARSAASWSWGSATSWRTRRWACCRCGTTSA